MLISYLASRKTVVPFKNIPELLEKTNYRVATAPGSAYSEAFRKSDNENYKRVWNERMQPYLDEYRSFVSKLNE